MNIHERLKELLVCPYDLQKLTHRDGYFNCTSCKRKYSIEDGIVHFVTSEDERPRNPRALAEDYAKNAKERFTLEYYANQARQRERMYGNNPALKDAVDFIVSRAGIVVDIATGHGGGYIAPVVARLQRDALLIATDACPPVIAKWSEYFSEQFADHFAFFDIDLEKALCFSDCCIDMFTGLGISNVSDGQPYDLLKEINRSLMPGGYGIFQEMFFDEDSKTAHFLSKKENLYASLNVFAAHARSIGFEMTKADEVTEHIGKIDPCDGWPIDENDRWFEMMVYLRKG